MNVVKKVQAAIDWRMEGTVSGADDTIGRLGTMHKKRATYFSVKVLFRSHVITGRLRRSLYVGSSTEYLSLDPLAIVNVCLPLDMSDSGGEIVLNVCR